MFEWLNLYNLDEGDGGGQPPADPPDDGNRAGEDKTFTQADMDRFAVERVRRAEAKAKADMLTALGFENEDQAKAFFDAAKKKAEDEKSEQQRLQEANERLTSEVSDLRTFKTRTLAERHILKAIDEAELEYVSEQARRDAIEAVLSGATVSDDGAIEDIKDRVKAVTESRMYLFVEKVAPEPKLPTTDAGKRTRTPSTSRDQILKSKSASRQYEPL